MTGYRCQNQCGGHPLSKLSINNLIRRLIIWGYSPPSNLSSEMKKRRKSHLTSWGGGLNWEIGIDIYTLLLNHFSHVRFCATPHTAAHQAPPFLGFSRQEHWSGLPFPSPKKHFTCPQITPSLEVILGGLSLQWLEQGLGFQQETEVVIVSDLSH